MTPADAPASPSPTAARRLGFVFAVLTALLWTGFFLVSRAGVRGTLDAADLTFLRFGVGALVLWPVLLRRGPGGLAWPRLAALVGTLGLGYALLAYSGLQRAPAAHAAVLMPGLLPVFAALLGRALLRRDPGAGRLTAGLAVIAAGALAFVLVSGPHGPGVWLGDACFCGASFLWALYTVLVRRWTVPPLMAVAVVACGSALAYAPWYLLTHPHPFAGAPLAEVLGQGLYQGGLAMALASLLYTRALALLGARLVTAVTSFVPGLTALGAAVVLHEPASPAALLGVGAVTLGVLLHLALPARPRGAVPAPRSGLA